MRIKWEWFNGKWWFRNRGKEVKLVKFSEPPLYEGGHVNDKTPFSVVCLRPLPSIANYFKCPLDFEFYLSGPSLQSEA